MNRHSQLVSQWQEHLASAEDLAASTARFRWIHLARVRLYRFLLACYGSGQWREDLPEPPASPGTVSEIELPLGGKPPKSVGAIQSVLKAVHVAQDRPPSAGPLMGGLDGDTYMAVTDSDAWIDVERCEMLLRDHGFHARVVGRGRRLTVEVPYRELREAEAFVDANRHTLRPPRRTTTLEKIRQSQTLTQMLIVGLLLIAPIVGLATLTLGALLLRPFGGPSAAGQVGLFLGAFLIVAQVSLLWYFLAPRWRAKLTLATRRRIAMAVFWICVGVPATFVMSVAIHDMRDTALVQSLISPAGLLAIVGTLFGIIAIWFDWLVHR